MRVSPGAYSVTTSPKLTAQEASDGLFPGDALVVHVETHRSHQSVTYVYLVDYPEGDNELVA